MIRPDITQAVANGRRKRNLAAAHAMHTAPRRIPEGDALALLHELFGIDN